MSEKKEITEEVEKKISFKDKLKQQVDYLTQEVDKKAAEVERSKASFNQYLGALDFAKAQLIEAEKQDE